MAQLLATLHSAPRSALQLKIDILKALLLCLRDSHRTRTVFRKVRNIFGNAYIYKLMLIYDILYRSMVLFM